MRRLGTVVLTALTAAACGGDGSDGTRFDVVHTVELPSGTEPVALAALPGGGLLVGERLTGDVRRIGPDLALSDPVAHVAVQAGEDDQRGLLGLAVDGERIYGAWTRAADGAIVVAEIGGGEERLVWEGPASSELANGGHLAFLDGRLLIGIGDLQDPERTSDPASPHGKLLSLDPDGPPDQRPTPLSDGWNNPFAFVVTEDDAVWVADNAPGDSPERIGRGDRATDRVALPGRRAPSALVEIGPGRLGLCGYLDGELHIVDVTGSEPRLGDAAATDCRTGAASLDDGRIAVSDGSKVRILATAEVE